MIIQAFRRQDIGQRLRISRALATSMLLDSPEIPRPAAATTTSPSTAPAPRTVVPPAVKARPSGPATKAVTKASPKATTARGKHPPPGVHSPSVAELLTAVGENISRACTSPPVPATLLDIFDDPTQGPIMLVDASASSSSASDAPIPSSSTSLPAEATTAARRGRKGPRCGRPCPRQCGRFCPRRDRAGYSRPHQKHECSECRALTNMGM